jgi:hypothetical protein
MVSVDGYTRDAIVSVIVDAVTTVSPDSGPVDEATYLLGSYAIVDSVGFITMLITLEQNLKNAVDLSASFMEQGHFEETKNPFMTVGSLANHIHNLLAAPT